MRQRIHPPESRHGTATIEFAVVAPLILLLLVGIWEVGRMLEVQQLMVNAAREGGRQATAGTPKGQIADQVRTYLRNAGLPADVANKATVSLDNTWKTPQDNPAYLVRVSVPLRDLRWTTLNLVTNENTTLTGEAVWARN